MTIISRRSILRTGAAGAAATIIPFPDWVEKYAAHAGPPLVRYSAQSSEGTAMLAKYNTVVGQMMMQAKGNPCSWMFQWYTHAVPTNTTKAAQVASLPSAQQPLANDMWNTCQAHSSTVGAKEDYFLPWHRMYVYFFERMVRKLSGDASFTLPYWDYTSSGNRAIPDPFRDPAATSNALYRAARNSGGVPGNANVNGGQAIDYGLSPTPLNLDALKDTDYSDFCSDLDGGLHGNVHVLTGNSVGMGQVPWAANDPVFWAHHCNIDRMWASWNKGGRVNPTSSSWLNKTFIFADENCNKVVGTIKDFSSIAPLNYTYDKFEPVPLKFTLNPGILKYLASIKLVYLPIPPGPLDVALPAVREGLKTSLPQRLTALGTNERLHIVLHGLSARAQPGVLYAVYVGLPPGSREIPKGAQPVGYINFFDAVPMEGMKMPATQKRFIFDVTESLRAAGPASLANKLNVTLLPLGRPNPESRPVIGQIDLVQQ